MVGKGVMVRVRMKVTVGRKARASTKVRLTVGVTVRVRVSMRVRVRVKERVRARVRMTVRRVSMAVRKRQRGDNESAREGEREGEGEGEDSGVMAVSMRGAERGGARWSDANGTDTVIASGKNIPETYRDPPPPPTPTATHMHSQIHIPPVTRPLKIHPNPRTLPLAAYSYRHNKIHRTHTLSVALMSTPLSSSSFATSGDRAWWSAVLPSCIYESTRQECGAERGLRGKRRKCGNSTREHLSTLSIHPQPRPQNISDLPLTRAHIHTYTHAQ